MTPKLLQDKEGQLKSKMDSERREILRLKHDETTLKNSIMILTRRLYSTQSQIEDLQRSWQALDYELAFLDGRYQEVKSKKSTTRTRKAKPDLDISAMTNGQLSFLKGALEKLMKEKETNNDYDDNSDDMD
jgi:chromosome segregation ATPase